MIEFQLWDVLGWYSSVYESHLVFKNMLWLILPDLFDDQILMDQDPILQLELCIGLSIGDRSVHLNLLLLTPDSELLWDIFILRSSFEPHFLEIFWLNIVLVFRMLTPFLSPFDELKLLLLVILLTIVYKSFRWLISPKWAYAIIFSLGLILEGFCDNIY